MTTRGANAWLGLDIGGANLKAAHSAGVARVLPFELWKRPEDLPRVLRELIAAMPPADGLAVTMTAELCDCYPTKARGVEAVLAAVESAFTGPDVRVWGTDERFHSLDEARAQPAVAAASNWLALATLAARLVPDGPGLLIDTGSTTTDLVPLCDGRPAPRGRTDTQRLRTGELVYAGVIRTPVCALAPELPWLGLRTGLVGELFASTLDVYLVLGDIPPDPFDRSTADGRPRTVEAARGRLARMVGGDLGSVPIEDALALARSADEALIDRLEGAAMRACTDLGRPRHVVVSGAGEFLARRLAQRVVEPGGTIIELRHAWGPLASSAGCAHALVILASEQVEPASSPSSEP